MAASLPLPLIVLALEIDGAIVEQLSACDCEQNRDYFEMSGAARCYNSRFNRHVDTAVSYSVAKTDADRSRHEVISVGDWQDDRRYCANAQF